VRGLQLQEFVFGRQRAVGPVDPEHVTCGPGDSVHVAHMALPLVTHERQIGGSDVVE
jgi:hypothetical protein